MEAQTVHFSTASMELLLSVHVKEELVSAQVF